MKKKKGTLWMWLLMIIFAACATAAGYAQPFPSGSSDRVMSRAEFIARIVDYFQWPHPSEYNDVWKAPLKPISDVRAGAPYAKQIETALDFGVVSLDSNGNFRPDSPISRQEAAALLAKVFMLSEETDGLWPYIDRNEISRENYKAVSALAGPGYMRGRSASLFKPNEPLTLNEFESTFSAITQSVVAPVQAVPNTNSIAPRRYVKLWTPTPGATIYFTSDGSNPTDKSPIYTVATNGHINEMLSTQQLPERDVVYKAFAAKPNMKASPVRTFTWHLYRPKIAEFNHRLLIEKSATRPAVFQIWCDAESVRAMAYYIEGQERGVCFDALQTPPEQANLKEYIEKNMATKPFSLVIGHEHGDHDAQLMNFLKTGLDVYANNRGWSTLATAGTFPAIVSDPADQAKIKNIDEGDILRLGGCDLYVYALPGHANGNVILQDKVNGLIFSSDIYGCTRAGSADNVNVAGAKVDVLLSLAQQVHSAYYKNNGKVQLLFTGHDETPLNAEAHLTRFEQALQKAIDYGESGCSPTLRGKNDAPGSRTVIIGDMWKDNTEWISLKIGGVMGDNYEYLSTTPINYNGNGFMKYAVLSNLDIEGGELEGVSVEWAKPTAPFQWAGKTTTVANALAGKFYPWTYSYTIRAKPGVDTITIKPTAMSNRITMMLFNGIRVENRASLTIPATDGYTCTLKIIAPDTLTTATYTLTVRQK